MEDALSSAVDEFVPTIREQFAAGAYPRRLPYGRRQCVTDKSHQSILQQRIVAARVETARGDDGPCRIRLISALARDRDIDFAWGR
jgi:hypothetical protein